MRIRFIHALAASVFLATSCTGMHPPTLDEDFIDPSRHPSGECARDTIEVLEKTLACNREDPEIYRELAVCYRAIGTPRSRLKSMQAIDRALELAPEHEGARALRQRAANR